MAAIAPSPKFQWINENGDPGVGYKLYTRESGTDTNKASYTDDSEAVANDNPIILNDDGACDLHLAEGAYRLRLEDSLGNLVWQKNGINASNLGGTYVPTIEDLKSITASGNSSVYVLGYYTKGDGGGGWFYWDSSNDNTANPDDGVVIFVPNSNPTLGAWKRIYNDTFSVKWGGAVGDGVTDDTAVFDNTMLSAANFGIKKIDLGSNDTYLIEPAIFTGTGTNKIVFRSNGSIVKWTSGNPDFTGGFEAGIYKVFDNISGDEPRLSGLRSVYVEWWGAKGSDNPSDAPENVLAIQSAFDCRHPIVRFDGGTYHTDATLTVPDYVCILEGSGMSRKAGVQGTVLQCTANTFDAVQILSQSDYLTVRDIHVVSPSIGTNFGFNLLESNNNIYFERVEATNFDHGFHSTYETFLQQYVQCRANTCDLGFFANGQTAASTGAGTTLIYDQCYANTCEKGFFAQFIKEVYYNTPTIDVYSEYGIQSKCTITNITNLHSEQGNVDDGRGCVEITGSIPRVLIINGLELENTTCSGGVHSAVRIDNCQVSAHLTGLSGSSNTNIRATSVVESTRIGAYYYFAPDAAAFNAGNITTLNGGRFYVMDNELNKVQDTITSTGVFQGSMVETDEIVTGLTTTEKINLGEDETAPEILNGVGDPGSGQTFTATQALGKIQLNYTNELKNLQKIRVSSSGTLPTGLSPGTDYWVIRKSATTCDIASSYANAVTGTRINYTDAGTGTHTVYLAPAKSSLFMRTDGSSTSTRAYIKTDDGIGWTNLITAA